MAEQKFYATGKRKTSIARVRMTPGTGEIIINKRTIDEYFGRPTSKMVVRQPLELTENNGKFDISAKTDIISQGHIPNKIKRDIFIY